MENSNGVTNKIVREFATIFLRLLPLWILIFAWSVRVEGFISKNEMNPSADYRQYLEVRFDALEKQLDEIKAEMK